MKMSGVSATVALIGLLAVAAPAWADDAATAGSAAADRSAIDAAVRSLRTSNLANSAGYADARGWAGGEVRLAMNFDDGLTPAKEKKEEPAFIWLKSRGGAVGAKLADGSQSPLSLALKPVAVPGQGPDHADLLGPAAMGPLDFDAPSSLLTNDTLQIGYFTPRYAGLLLGIGSDQAWREDDGVRGFGIAITSTYYRGDLGLTAMPAIDLSVLNRASRAYDVGLNMGVAGFKLGASFLKGQREADFGYRGYDFGLMYEGRSWATSLQFAEYTQRNSLLSFGPIDSDKVQSVKLGASYTFGFGLTLAGRIQYYDYRSSFLREDADAAQVFFLGTRLNF